MLSRDVHIGCEYAARESHTFGPVPVPYRLRAVTAPAHGRVSVEVLALSEQNWQRRSVGETYVVSTRSLLCAWKNLAELQGSEANQRANFAADLAQRLDSHATQQATERAVAPHRKLAETYSANNSQNSDAAEIVGGLGCRVIHDVQRHSEFQRYVKAVLDVVDCNEARHDLAVATIFVAGMGRSGREEMTGEPRAVWRVLEAAATMIGNVCRGQYGMHVGQAYARHDEPFVAACVAHVAAEGGQLSVPEVPVLPLFDSLRHRPPGWARLAYGYTGGAKLHAPDCRTLSGRGETRTKGGTMAAWTVALSRAALCGTCDGPDVEITPAVVAFRVASDVWNARAGGTIEPWQVRALLHLLASAAGSRAEAGEPPVTLAVTVWSALTEHRLGEEDRLAARQMLNNAANGVHMNAAVDERILRLGIARILQLTTVVPHQMMPPLPAFVQSVAAGSSVTPTRTDLTDVGRWFAELLDALYPRVPYLMSALFAGNER